MTFANQKKTFLAKLDRSKKGSIDEKAKPIIKAINETENYYTTSSCSGRVYFWQGAGKKNQTEWIKVSHDLIRKSFFNIQEPQGTIWLRYESFIIHIACKDIQAAKKLLLLAQNTFKKSSILSISNKIILEIRGSSFIEMPFYNDNEIIFNGSTIWLKDLINTKLKNNWKKIEKLKKEITENF